MCGYTFPQIDEMTLHDYHALCEYWNEHPPFHIRAAAHFPLKRTIEAEILDCTKISPSIGDFPAPPRPKRQRAANDIGTLLRLAKSGEVSMAALMGAT